MILVHKHCSNDKSKCTRSLRIDHNKDIIELLPELRVTYKNFEYSILQVSGSSAFIQFHFTLWLFQCSQAEQIAAMSPDISIHRVGDSVLFRSEAYGFWIIWDIHLNVKIGVSRVQSSF